MSENAKLIIERLQRSGYSCYAVGGCVRDSLLGLEPHDWDFTTSALPDEIERVFSDCKTVTVGKRFGTIAVILDERPYEITTYRIDGVYSDTRHPDEVRFSDRLRDDLARIKSVWPALTEEQRFLLERKYLAGASDAELAEYLDCQPGSVRMKLTRARRRVMEILKEGGALDEQL